MLYVHTTKKDLILFVHRGAINTSLKTKEVQYPATTHQLEALSLT